MHDALDLHTAQCQVAARATAAAGRPRRRFFREAFDDWDGSRHRVLAAA